MSGVDEIRKALAANQSPEQKMLGVLERIDEKLGVLVANLDEKRPAPTTGPLPSGKHKGKR